MNTPMTDVSQALAHEGRCASEDSIKARHEIIAELARVTAENTRLRAELRAVYEGTKHEISITPLAEGLSQWHYAYGRGYYALAKIGAGPDKNGIFGGRISSLNIWRIEDIFHKGRAALWSSTDQNYKPSDLDWGGLHFLFALIDQVDGQALRRAVQFAAGVVWGFVRRMFRLSWEA
jgi:hypothetical protein